MAASFSLQVIPVVVLLTLLLHCSTAINSQPIVYEDSNIKTRESLTVTDLSCGLVKQNGKAGLDGAYADCNNGAKTCYGDKVKCVDNMSCTRMSALIISETHFHVEFYSKCALDVVPGRWGDYYLAAAVNETIEVEDVAGERRVICKDPQREDFKLFHFWPKLQRKCNSKTPNFALELVESLEISFASLIEKCNEKYQNPVEIIDIPSVFNLTYWIDNNKLLHSSNGRFIGKTGIQIENIVNYEIVDGISCISKPYEEEDPTPTDPGQGTTVPNEGSEASINTISISTTLVIAAIGTILTSINVK